MSLVKTMSLRLEDSQYDALKIVADAEAIPVSKAIRDAIDRFIDERSVDPSFQAQLEAADERRRAALRFLQEQPPAVRTRMAAAERLRQLDGQSRTN
jgi:predicted DNA-binding protein